MKTYQKVLACIFGFIMYGGLFLVGYFDTDEYHNSCNITYVNHYNVTNITEVRNIIVDNSDYNDSSLKLIIEDLENEIAELKKGEDREEVEEVNLNTALVN